jgi:hypothetical protein
MLPSHFSSDQFAQSRFALHGRTEAQVQGRFLRVLLWGPFNLELVQAQCRLLRAAGAKLPPDKGYLELVEFRDSLLLPMDGWDLMQGFIDQGVAAGYCATATVLVISPDIEGYGLFWKRAESMWSRSRPVHVVATRASGEALLQRVLVEHSLDDTVHRAGLGVQQAYSTHPA